MAHCQYDKYIGEVLNIFGDVPFLSKICFRKLACDLKDSDYFDEKELCNLILDFARESIALVIHPMRALCDPLVLVIQI